MQLRKKLCYLTIMVLSCCALLAVLTSHPFTILCEMLWLIEKFNEYPKGIHNFLRSHAVFVAFDEL